ncbi:MAG: lactate utilization protein C [Betaproteobacteria bacterium]|nr:lactate utilization protein C [Betaproteobacteria bacterium]
MSARDSILNRIRAVKARGEAPAAAARNEIGEYIRTHPESPRPTGDWELVPQFRRMAAAMSSTVDDVAALGDVPGAVAMYLKGQSLPLEAVCWPQLANLDWAAAGIRIHTGRAQGADMVGVTGAFCAIAETGTLLALSGEDTPASASLVPETHIAVVPVSRIVRGMEDAFALVRAERGQPPRAMNFISGPSRTGDIELNITLGAHGPFRVHILLVQG